MSFHVNDQVVPGDGYNDTTADIHRDVASGLNPSVELHPCVGFAPMRRVCILASGSNSGVVVHPSVGFEPRRRVCVQASGFATRRRVASTRRDASVSHVSVGFTPRRRVGDSILFNELPSIYDNVKYDECSNTCLGFIPPLHKPQLQLFVMEVWRINIFFN